MPYGRQRTGLDAAVMSNTVLDMKSASVRTV